VSDLYIPTFGPPIFLQKKGRLIRGIAAQFLSWEYLFRNFGIVSLQCGIMKSLSEFQLRISILRLVFSFFFSVKRHLCMQDGSGEIDMDEMCEIFCLMYTIQVREGSGPQNTTDERV
jgi:hypothetical protein